MGGTPPLATQKHIVLRLKPSKSSPPPIEN